MKRSLHLIIIILCIQKLNAQVVFCPPGAEWNYTFNEIGLSSYIVVNESIKYAGDSVVNNESFKVLHHKKFFTKHNIVNVSTSLIKQTGDTIFVRNQCTANRWQILYNFAALPGQSWNSVVYPWGPSASTYSMTYTVSVDSVSSVTINNVNLKRLYVRYSSYAGSNAAVITERLGCETFMFNYANSMTTDGDWFSENLCYKDSVFGLKQYSEKPCNYTYYVGLKEYISQSHNFKIYPNPGSDFLMIDKENELVSGPVIVSIENQYGQEIKQVLVNNLTASTRIDMNGISEGVYVLKLIKDNSVIYSGKLIKSE